MKPLVYLAGPITKPDPNVNTHDAIHIADSIMAMCPCVLFIPQYSVLHQIVSPKSHKDWLDYDLDVIEHCAAVLRIKGDSVGADTEVRWADHLGIPVYFLSDYGAPPTTFVEYCFAYEENQSYDYETRMKEKLLKETLEVTAGYADYGFRE